MSERYEKIRDIISIFMGVTGTVISTSVGFPVPLGVVVSVVYLFSKYFRRNLFSVSESTLRKSLREAIVLEHKYESELNYLEKVRERVMKNEILVEDARSLNMRIKQLDEKKKLIRTKIRILEAAIAIRENIKLFEELFGERTLRELAADPSRLSAIIDEILEEKGIKEVDLEALTEQLEVILPLIIKEPERFAVEKPVKVSEKARPKAEVTYDVEVAYKLLDTGSVKQWIEEIDKASKEGRRIRIPPISSRDLGKVGYKNFLIAVYSTDFEKLRNTVDSRLALRLAELVLKLKSAGALELDPADSDVGYLDEFLETVKDNKEGRVAENTKIEVYEFRDADNEVVRIEKVIVKDPRGKALKIQYKLVNTAS